MWISNREGYLKVKIGTKRKQTQIIMTFSSKNDVPVFINMLHKKPTPASRLS